MSPNYFKISRGLLKRNARFGDFVPGVFFTVACTPPLSLNRDANHEHVPLHKMLAALVSTHLIFLSLLKSRYLPISAIIVINDTMSII